MIKSERCILIGLFTLNNRKVKSNTVKNPFKSDDEIVTIEIDKSVKLCGDALAVNNTVKSELNKHCKAKQLPGSCDLSGHIDNNRYRSEIVYKKYTVNNDVVKHSDIDEMLAIAGESVEHGNRGNEEGNQSNSDANRQSVVIHEVPDTWLRVYPAGSTPKESVCSIIFRCLCCQLGLFSFLVIWTLIFVMVIHSIEGPYEVQVGEEFEIAQNRLIIQLATELRQLQTYSDKWRLAIENSIRRERILTINAVKKGARIHAGTFWDIAGTCLFCVYVMTALGFGAPVPQTVYGRTLSLLYAAIAVPSHIFLMVNLSSFVVIQAEKLLKQTKALLKRKLPILKRKSGQKIASKSTPAVSKSRNKVHVIVLYIVKLICIGRCIPLAAVLYYILGVIVFGVLRNKPIVSALMFPLEFTTTGGLEHVEDIVRCVYGLYVEGAMILLSCGLATLRRHSGSAVTNMTSKFRLFKRESCRKCSAGRI